ncbi:antiterminator LoaP [Pelosinus fermentans]|uniref:Transcription termination/antitermination protein NusG n=1 Tax=Pelosinus fermentans JBW45 TaxID=1192197 RepID=I9NRF0_9FIRM|nr:antiterminator LoaP [Pelosinus fermentans]AJQ26585.1 NusG antitermination factor [Pelosinus fermentans JBW45]
MMYWYVLWVKTGAEEGIQKCLQSYFDYNTLHSLIPKRLLIEKRQGVAHLVQKKMFPGYVFICADMNYIIYNIIKKIPKIIKILNSNGSYYSAIDDSEINIILSLVGSGDIVKISRIHIKNSKIFILNGPLKNLEGIVKRIDKHKKRAKILINLLNTPKLIDVGIEIV